MYCSPYSGSNQLHIGNGQGLSISNIGYSEVLSSSKTSHSLSVTDLLHGPSITKNLLSVSRLARDNGVYFEFHPTSYFVKSHDSNEVLLWGYLDKHGVYKFTQFLLAIYPRCHPLLTLSQLYLVLGIIIIALMLILFLALVPHILI